VERRQEGTPILRVHVEEAASAELAVGLDALVAEGARPHLRRHHGDADEHRLHHRAVLRWSCCINGRKVRSSRFNALTIAVLIGAVLFALTTIYPIEVTIYAVVLSAVTLPVIFLPPLIVGNDRRVMGPTLVNGKLANTLGSLSMLVVAAALLAIPLLIATKAGMG
jgi:hypothetical protein